MSCAHQEHIEDHADPEMATHLSAHSAVIQAIHESSEMCQPIVPYPTDVKLKAMMQHQPEKIPATFHLKANYNQILDQAKCQAMYQRVSSKALLASISDKQMHPSFRVAQVNSKITFFNNVPSFKISDTDLKNLLNAAKNLPTHYNWATVNPEITTPQNQGLCGSCWAVSSATCLSDTFVVSKRVKANPMISPTYILSCLPQGQCNGGDPGKAVNDMENNGVSTNSCLDYSWCNNTGCGGDPLKHFDAQNVNQYIPSCKCNKPSSEYFRYFADQTEAICIPPNLSDFSSMEQVNIKYYLQGLYGQTGTDYANLANVSYKDIQSLIKNHIYNYGPVLGGFHVFKNFFKGSYSETNGIYIETASYDGVPGVNYLEVERDWVGSHAVVIVGWGTDTVHGESVDYWVVRNSWGTSWGDGGYWKMGMYGNDANKKYQNRFSQFEYPSIVNTDEGIALTGGVILMKAGKIEAFQQGVLTGVVPVKTVAASSTATWFSFAIFILFLFALYKIYSKQPSDSNWLLIGKTFLVVIITGYVLAIDPTSSMNRYSTLEEMAQKRKMKLAILPQ